MIKGTITLSASAPQVSAALTNLVQSQVGYAALRTVNDLAFFIKEEIDTEMEGKFHKPTKFTMSAIQVFKDISDVKVATPGGPRMANPRTSYASFVGLKTRGMPMRFSKAALANPDSMSVYDESWERALAHQFTGGIRPYKPFESALFHKGLLPSGHYAVPASGCPMDSFDNPQHGFVVSLLRYFAAYKENGYRTNFKEKGRKTFEKRLSQNMGGAFQTDFFVVSTGRGARGLINDYRMGGGLHAGIWQRFHGGPTGKTAVRPVFLFVPRSNYRRLIPFDELARETFAREVVPTFNRHLLSAIGTAKGIKNLVG